MTVYSIIKLLLDFNDVEIPYKVVKYRVDKITDIAIDYECVIINSKTLAFNNC